LAAQEFNWRGLGGGGAEANGSEVALVEMLGRKPGVDVMVNYFGDFCRFSSKIWRFS
jgi:hypothetical protein